MQLSRFSLSSKTQHSFLQCLSTVSKDADLYVAHLLYKNYKVGKSYKADESYEAHNNVKLITIPGGGGKRTRTADILLAKQALYQLSYTPTQWAILDSNQGPHPYQGCALTT